MSIFVSNYRRMDYCSYQTAYFRGLNDFIEFFNKSLDHDNGLLSQALDHIKQRAGKRMPMLILLIAKNFGKVSDTALHAAVGLELLHATASLVHDDVVDESAERRGQES